MHRRIARFVFVILLGTLAMVLGVVTSMTLTPPGRDLLARSVSRFLDRVVNGRVHVGAISGSFLYDLVLTDLVVRDTSGALLADLPRARVGFRLPNLVAGEFVLGSVQLDRPVIQLIKHRNGRMNYEDVLRIGKGTPGGKSPLVDFHNVRIADGTLRIALPWNPDRSLHTRTQKDSALAAERAKPGRMIEESPEGLRRVILLSELTTRLGRLRIATPDRLPFTIDIDSIATRLNDPAVTVRDAVGRVRLRGDSAVFSLSRAALPDTRFTGGGAVTWPRDTIMYDFQVISQHVNLEDLRWVSPGFPSMTGSGILSARSINGHRTEYDIRDLHLGDGPQRVDGNLVAITERPRGLGVRDMRITLRDLDLDAARYYVDSLPFYGSLTGSLAGNGFLDDMQVRIDWAFADARVPGGPVTLIAGDGGVGARRDSGLTFTDFAVRSSDVDLRTVRLVAPAVILEGRRDAVGTLDGPLHNVTFQGTARHQDGSRPPSTAVGSLSLDTRRDTLALATDVRFEPLSFEGIRRAFPSLKSRGELRGRFRGEGTLDDLAVEADLSGELGSFTADGRITIEPPHWAAENLMLTFSRLDLATLTGRDIPTSLAGELQATGRLDTLRAPEGRLTLALGRSRVREWTIDSVFARGQSRDSLLRLDTAYAEWQGARAAGSGSLGWGVPHSGRMEFALAADSLVAFDSLLLAATGQHRDTTPDSRPLNGAAVGRVVLAGSLDTLQVSGDLEVRDFTFQTLRSPRMAATFTSGGGGRPHVVASAEADTLLMGTYRFSHLGGRIDGYADSLAWAGGSTLAEGSRIDGVGQYELADSIALVWVDSLRAALPSHTYILTDRAVMALAKGAPTLTPVSLEATDGSGALRMSGTIPDEQPGALAVETYGLDLQDLYSLLGRDTLGVAGEVGLTLQVGGTARAPTIRGTGRVDEARFGDFRAPFVQGVLNYQKQRLDANLDLWRTGENILTVEAHLPMDLALRGVERRRVEGPLTARAYADSVDLGLLEALTPAVDRVEGRLAVNVQAAGTWKEPRLSGTVAVHNGSMNVPGLGVHLGSVDGSALLAGDSVLLKDVRITSGGGDLAVRGGMQLEDLSRPILALDVRADQFRAVDVRNFLTLVATGDIQLRGPVFGATLTGNLTANSGVLYFADLVNKRVIDLEDPAYADLLDTTLVRRENLGSKFQNRFMDSLRVEDLRIGIGSDVWLRSAEANIQLDGSVRLTKFGQEYQPTGRLNAPRGSYTLKIGPVTRDFTVNRGEVQYIGNLNANLDIQAQHTVRAVRGEEIPIIANIEGTLYAPKVTLESTLRPPISETDLVSYLVTGYPANDAAQFGQSNAVLTGLAYFSSALSSELERALIQDFGVPIDLIEIRPGVSPTGGGDVPTQVAAGWQIGRKSFLTFNAGFCPDFSQFSTRNFGASFEFRFNREWRFMSSVEPTYQSCSGSTFTNPFLSNNRYQIGTDILWEREF
jgi:translocation and assembly module TamB